MISVPPTPAQRPARRRLRQITPREWLLFVLPALTLVVGAFWVTLRFVQPAPPSRLTITTGGQDGAYHRFAEKYREILARDGVTLEIKPSGGSVDNLKLLRDDSKNIEVGFVQGGLGMLTLTPLAQPPEQTRLYSLANVFYEPVWVFYRGKKDLTRIAELAGLRIAVGHVGSGSQKVAIDLLRAHGVDDARLSDLAGGAAVDALLAGTIDGLFMIAAPEAPVVRRLLETSDLKLMNFDNALALSRRFPYLKPITLARGVVDLKANYPAQDMQLVATEANLVIREDLHPALAYLLLEATVEVHGTPGLFNQPGAFPTPQSTDWPLADEARRYFKTGRPFLQRYLPFWLANFVERMLVLLVPIFAVVVPLVKFLPEVFSWRQRAKVNRWYGELKFLENDADAGSIDASETVRVLERLNRMEENARDLPIPVGFSDRVYTLRQHIDYVRAKLAHKTAAAPPTPS